MKYSIGWAALLLCLVSSVLLAPVAARGERPPYMGWAQEAHCDYSAQTFRDQIREQKKYGANLVWIGHNNPGYVDIEKEEPGLSYAVYEAIKDPSSPVHAQALEQAAAVRRLIEAARQEQLKVVLAVGYQIMMGPAWDARHKDSLRRDKDGRFFNAGGPSACWLSPDYQRDIREYYQWVQREWVRPYRDVILMLNLADEPFGGDYSHFAEEAFKKETGLTFKKARKTEAGRDQLGSFQNLYIVRYAVWSARLWQEIDPRVRVTMSFCGEHGRFANVEPNVSAIFEETPENFDVTFDAFLIDNLQGKPINDYSIVALGMFMRQLGALSQKHNKRVWLWPNANNWILSQWHEVKGNISDALFGVSFLRNVGAGAGIRLGGLAVWNLNVKKQGLFRDERELSYDPKRMFEKISNDFQSPSDPAVFTDEVMVWAPQSEANSLIGRKSYDYADRIFYTNVYGPLLEKGVIPNLSAENVPPLEGVKTLFMLSKFKPKLKAEGYSAVEAYVRGAGPWFQAIRSFAPADGGARWFCGPVIT